MDKRVIIAIVLCIGILAAWSKLFPPASAPPAQQTATAPASPTTPPPAGSTAPPPVAGAAAAPAAGAAAVPAAGAAPAANPAPPEQQVALETPDMRFVLSNRGGTLLHALLLDKKFLDGDPGQPRVPHDLVRTVDPKDAALRTSFPDSSFPTTPDGTWNVSQPSPGEVVFSTDSGSAHIEKRYKVEPTRFRLHLDVVVSNRGDKPLEHHFALAVSGRQDPDKRGGGLFSGPAANPASVLCSVNDKLERHAIDDLNKDPFNVFGAVRWVATDEKFFLFAAVPFPETPADRRCAASALPGDSGAGQVTLSFAGRTVAPGQAVSYPFTVYAGPKYIQDLEQVRPGNVEAKLDQAVDVTLAILSRPILSLLKFFHGFAHNWGLAIVLLTLFIKLVTFYPTQKSLLSAKKMQRLGPKMNAIRKKYENDRQRQSVETMNLYKAHGVSPLGGCLPSLIQMPIWIALYSTLNYAVELHHAPFFAHINDLTAKDRFYVTPLVMGAVMFLQMKMSPAGADSQQQAMMSVMMPVMFTIFSLFLPSGLALYMLTSYLIGILQQLYVNHLDRKGAIA